MSKTLHVVAQPHSNSNPSDEYRVQRYSDWLAWYSGGASHVDHIATFDNYTEAKALADLLSESIEETS